MTVNSVYWDREDKDEDDHDHNHDQDNDRKLKLQYNNECMNLLELMRKAWKKSLRAYVDNAIKITTINVN